MSAPETGSASVMSPPPREHDAPQDILARVDPVTFVSARDVIGWLKVGAVWQAAALVLGALTGVHPWGTRPQAWIATAALTLASYGAGIAWQRRWHTRAARSAARAAGT
jgi:hypothetical protein